MSSLDGKRALVTGATSGIGREVAVRLGELGADIALACRDVERAEPVAARIEATGGRATVMLVDMSSQRSVRELAAEVRARHGALDVLVNNAGVLLPQRQISVDGIERTFATNVLGYHALTALLLGTLRAAPAARIVNVASTFAFGVDLDDLQFQGRRYDGMTAYAQSKACNRMLTWALDRRLTGSTVTANAMAPGLVLDTGLYRQLSVEARGELAAYGTRTVEAGADTAIWLASSTDVDGVSGRFFEQRIEVPCEHRDQDAEERLWLTCNRLVDELAPRS